MDCCRRSNRVLLLALTLWISQALAVEVVQITGRVTDKFGNPLPGANVMAVNTSFGAATDVDGIFQFAVPVNLLATTPHSFKASFIGYKSVTDSLKYTGEKTLTLNFKMVPDVLALEAVVVTGLGGLEEKRKLGVLIESVKPEIAAKSGETNLVTALRGNVPGFEIRKTSGDAGTNAYFKIRGTGTISGGHEPLMVIDGTPVNSGTRTVGSDGTVESPRNRPEASSRSSDINIDDIESIEVLKGAAASAIYGSRASNGVILITTKSGKTGKLELGYKTVFGISALNSDYPLQKWFGQGTGGEYVQNSALSWGQPLNTPSAPWYDPDQPEDEVYDHVSDISNFGYNFEQHFNASGGFDRTKFYFSMSRVYERSHWIGWEQYQDLLDNTYGHVPSRVIPSDYLRHTVRLKGSHMITEDLTLVTGISYVRVNTNNVPRAHTTDGLGRGLLSTPPDFNLLPYLHEQTQYHRSSTNEDSDSPYGPHSWNNPYWVLYEIVQHQEMNRVYGNIKLDYKPTDWSTISYNFGTDYSTDFRFDLLPIGTYRDEGEGRLIINIGNQLEWDGNLIFNIDGNKLFGYPIKLTFGHNLNSRGYEAVDTRGTEQNVMSYYQMENYTDQTVSDYVSLIHTESLFGQITYDFRDYLFLTAAIRRDGSSTFGPADREHIFRKLSGAWNFTENVTIPYVTFGKLRAAWGEAGEQPDVYDIYSGYVSDNIGVLSNKTSLGSSGSYSGVLGYVSDSRLGNQAIRPERRSEKELGLDLAILENRMGLNLTAYKAISNDVIFTMDVAPSTGSDILTANGAIIENMGLEFSLNVNLIQRKNLNWSARFLYSHNDNLLVEMNGIDSHAAAQLDPSNVPMIQLSKFTFTAPGHPVGEFRGYSWARFGYGIIATDTDENGQSILVNIDSAYAGKWKRNDVYIQRNGLPDINWQYADGSSGGYIWSGYSADPIWSGSIYNEIKVFNNLSFSALIDISVGGYIVNYTKNKLDEIGTYLDTESRYNESFDDPDWYGYEEGVSTKWGKGKFVEVINSDHEGIGPGQDETICYDEEFYTVYMGTQTDIINNIEDGSHIKLREVSVSYRVNSPVIKKVGLRAIDLRLSARDLLTLTRYTGWDPETNMMQNRISGEDYFNQPQTWGANFSINLMW